MFFFFFPTEDVGSLKTQITPKNTKKNKYLAEKKKKKNGSKRIGRGTLNTCAKFQALSLKNGVDIGL